MSSGGGGGGWDLLPRLPPLAPLVAMPNCYSFDEVLVGCSSCTLRVADVARGADVDVASFSLGCRCCCRWIRYSRKNTVGEKPVLLINAVTSIATWLWSYRLL